ncbi:hypothetical protein T265_16133, partial [Opisthorchis viverrini]
METTNEKISVTLGNDVLTCMQSKVQSDVQDETKATEPSLAANIENYVTQYYLLHLNYSNPLAVCR